MQSIAGIDDRLPVTLKPKVAVPPAAMVAFQPDGPAICMSPMVLIVVFHESRMATPEFAGHSQWTIQFPMVEVPVFLTVMFTVAPPDHEWTEAVAVQAPVGFPVGVDVGVEVGVEVGVPVGGLTTPPSLPGRSAPGRMPVISPLPPSNSTSEQA
jgi:hypothetical protein